MVRLGSRTLNEALTYTNSTKDSMAIPRDRMIREINLRFAGTLNNGHATEARNVAIEEVLKALGHIRLVANGSDTLRSVNAFRKYIQTAMMRGSRPYNDAIADQETTNPNTWLVAASDAKTFIVNVPLDFALDPGNEWDLSACIPAHMASSLNLEISNAAPTTADITITAATVEVTIKEAFMSAREMSELYGGKMEKLVKLYESEVGPKVIDATYTELGYEIDLPTGAIIQNMGVFLEDGTTPYAGNDTAITKFQVKQESPVVMELDTLTWQAAQEMDKTEHKVESLHTGFCLYDAQNRGGGLDARGLKSGDLKIRANTAATGRVTLLNRSYL